MYSDTGVIRANLPRLFRLRESVRRPAEATILLCRVQLRASLLQPVLALRGSEALQPRLTEVARLGPARDTRVCQCDQRSGPPPRKGAPQ